MTNATTGTTGPPGMVNAAGPWRRNTNTDAQVPAYTSNRLTALNFFQRHLPLDQPAQARLQVASLAGAPMSIPAGGSGIDQDGNGASLGLRTRVLNCVS